MNSSDLLPTPKGRVNVKIYEHGKLVSDETTNNLVVTLGRTLITKLLGGTVGDTISIVGFGTSSAATSISDTVLNGPPFTKAIGAVTYPSPSSMQIAFTLATSEANGMTIQELGLIDSNGDLFSRMTRGAIVKTSAISLVCTWTLSF